MLVMSDKLNKSPRTGLEGLSSGRDDFEVHSSRCFLGEGRNLPSGRLTNANFGFTYATRLLLCGDSVSNQARYFQLLCRLNGVSE